MAEMTDADGSLDERVSNVARNTREMGRAVRDALLQHKRAGNPVAVWRDQQVVWIAPEDIPTNLDETDVDEDALSKGHTAGDQQ
jgi:hypothetical protein